MIQATLGALRFALIAMLSAVACGHPAEKGTVTPVAHAGSGSGSASGSASGAGSGSATKPPVTPTASGGLPVAGVACAPLGCVYHAGANAYFACMSAGAGACFHFGARCAPADACMYDAAAKRYQHCEAVVEGACTKWGAGLHAGRPLPVRPGRRAPPRVRRGQGRRVHAAGARSARPADHFGAVVTAVSID